VKKELKKYRDFAQLIGPEIKFGENLANWTTLGIGGKSDLFYVAGKPQDLIKATFFAKKFSIPYFILGGGSNLLVSDEGFRGVVIKNDCNQIKLEKNKIICQSGALLKDAVSIAKKNSLSGLEFAVGIWGTVGGAVYGNAGAFSRSIGDILEEGVILTPSGNIENVKKDFFKFSYRHSKLKSSRDILLSVVFKLKKGNTKKIENRMTENLAQRSIKVPDKTNTAGCYFKNPVVNGEIIPAGKLLEQVGAKNLRIGDAAIYSKHANIIVNLGKAKAKDVKSLADILKRRVKQRFDIGLEEEVIFLG
jgi:UDP-N-acetylmuramate dehydrogenase